MPRLALYTGARANELCGLLVRDAKTIDGVPCVGADTQDGIVDSTHSSSPGVDPPGLPGLRGATARGRASTPLPRVDRGEIRLRLGAVLEEIRSAASVHRNHRQEEVLHSARHTVKDQLRAAQVPVAVPNAILRHA